MSKHLSDHHGAHMLVQPATVPPVLVSLDYFRRPRVWGDTLDRSAGKGTQKKRSVVYIHCIFTDPDCEASAVLYLCA